MMCPGCESNDSHVSRTIKGKKTTRERNCICGCRWSTLEVVIAGSVRLGAPNSTTPLLLGAVNSGEETLLGAISRHKKPLDASKGFGVSVSDLVRSDLSPVLSVPSQQSGSSSEGDLRSDQARVREPRYTDEFKTFWMSYPRKTGKGAAWASWTKLSPRLADVLKALAWQRQSYDWRKDAGAYVPMPATYLNQRRWEDEPKGTATAPAGPLRPALSVAEVEQRREAAQRASDEQERKRLAEAEQFKRARAADWMGLIGQLADAKGAP